MRTAAPILASLKTVDELVDWAEYRKFLKTRIGEIPDGGAPMWVSIEPFAFSKWEHDVVLIGGKCKALAKALKKQGVRLKAGICFADDEVLRVEGFSGGILKGATRTLDRLALGYRLDASPAARSDAPSASDTQTETTRKDMKKKPGKTRDASRAAAEAAQVKISEVRRNVDRRIKELVGASDIDALRGLAAAASNLFKRGTSDEDQADERALVLEATKAEYEEQKRVLIPRVKTAIKRESPARAQFKQLGAEAAKQARAEEFEDALETMARIDALLDQEEERTRVEDKYKEQRDAFMPKVADAIKAGAPAADQLRDIAREMRALEEAEDWAGAGKQLKRAADLL